MAYEKGKIRTDSGEFIDKGNQCVDVRHPDFHPRGTHGGALGDGSTDDTDAIAQAQAFLDSIGGGILFFPPGTYCYSDDVLPTASVTWRGCGRGVSILKRISGSGIVVNPTSIDDVLIEGLTFDHNGDTSSFSGAIRASGCKRVAIRNCSFTDSNPLTGSVSLGTGDGTTKTFSVTTSGGGDYMVLPGTVSLVAGAVSLVDGWQGQWVDDDANPGTYMSSDVVPCVLTVTTTGNLADNDVIQIRGISYRFKNALAQANDVKIGASASATLASFVHALNGTGSAGTDYFAGTEALDEHGTASSTSTTLTFLSSFEQDTRIREMVDSGTAYSVSSTNSRIEYGTNNGDWAATVTFTTAPANGTAVTLSYGYCDQRQPILLLSCEDVLVQGNFIERGGRIKVGRPGNRCIISENILRGVNDNGITIVDEVGQFSSDIIIRGNIIYFPSTTGIFAGADVGAPPTTTIGHKNIQVIGNTIVCGPAIAINIGGSAGTTSSVHIQNNHIRRVGRTNFGSDRSAIFYHGAESDVEPNEDIWNCSITGNTIEGEFRQRYINATGRNVDVSGNAIAGFGLGVAVELGNCKRANIHHNTAEGVTRFLLADGTEYEDITIERNNWHAEITTSDAGHILFDEPTTLRRLSVVGNKAIGETGSGQRHVLEIDGALTVDLEFSNNDWSAESTMRGIDLDGGAALATTSRLWGNRGAGTYGTTWVVPAGTEIRFSSTTGAGIFSGTGSPEAAVTAPVGSLFLRTDGGTDTSVYAKESGAGNTGWVGLGAP